MHTPYTRLHVLHNCGRHPKLHHLWTPQCGFVRLFTITPKNDALDVVNRLLHNKYHNSIEELNRTIEILPHTLAETEKTTKEDKRHSQEHENIKRYIDTHYEIIDDLNYKIKASVLCQKIARHLIYDEVATQGLNVRLSNYLKEMGLQKKRYNDGYYYYGLKPKVGVSPNDIPQPSGISFRKR